MRANNLFTGRTEHFEFASSVLSGAVLTAGRVGVDDVQTGNWRSTGELFAYFR
jgi:hypothetical protein